MYSGCNEDEMVVQKRYSWYRVTLGSGTEIGFYINRRSRWITSIQIVSSTLDAQNVEGMCGNYNGDRYDDFIPRGESSSTWNKNKFTLSWRVSWRDSLFAKNPRALSGDGAVTKTDPVYQTKFCTCSSYWSVRSSYRRQYYAKCNLEAPTEPCSSGVSQTVNVCSQNRRKRDTVDSDDVMDDEEEEFGYDPEYNDTIELPEATWINGWNETSATDYCNKTFALDPVVSFCIEQVNTSIAKYINGCISDIEKIGNTDFVEATLDTLKKECVTTASRDESFQKSDNSSSNSTDGDGVSVLDMLSTMVCPNNCSQKGACINETCLCNDGYIGDDCSSQLSVPPSDLSVPEHGLCDTSKRACRKTNVVGTFNSENIIAHLTYFQSTSNGMDIQDYSVSTNVTYRHMNLVTVSLPDSPSSRRRKRSAGSNIYGWIIKLSYDGTSFGNSTTILLFNSVTESCEATTLICTVK
ncbi:uncharacterized protein LOC134242087, partial [Saccostrea cucullata]|uniref:uncharacterized protein LOC134242087 n=1 Tax=Saccostrea cuccullata TaxID=36930 RepID=UPI002ED56042